MKLSRKTTNAIRYFVDEYLPPVIRDSRWFMILPLRFMLRRYAEIFLRYKDRALRMNDQEFMNTYRQILRYSKERETDLNEKTVSLIQKNIIGRSVLDVGCGRGYLAHRLSSNHRVTAVDIVIEPYLVQGYPGVRFLQGNAEKLPFDDHVFDTVVCAHTLEHVRNITTAIRELRRVTKKRLIIVVPKQRPYRYTFDLHLHFFPYAFSLISLMGVERGGSCVEIDGDFLYREDM